MIVIVVLLLALAGSLGLLKYLGSLAMRPAEIEVDGVPLELIIDVGTRASHSWARRLLGRPNARPMPGGGAEWTVKTGAGVMGVRVSPTPTGYRVVAHALTMRIAQHEGWINLDSDWGKAKLLTNWLFAALGIPHNPRKLLRQRKRVFRAITKAAAVPAAVRAPQGTSGS